MICIFLGFGIKELDNGDIYRFGVVYIDGFLFNWFDCMWIFVGDVGFMLKMVMDGIVLGYKMVVII